jgi:nucleotide-binding universal stress UspA family protein
VPETAGLPTQRILVAVDPRAYDDEHADVNATLMELAKSLHEMAGGQVLVAHAWDLFGEQLMRSRLTPQQIEELKADERSEAEKALRELIYEHGLSLNPDQVVLKQGDPSIVIPQLVDRKKIDLLVIGTVARGGIARVMMGNTAETILNRVQCSVLAVKPKNFVSAIRLEDERHQTVTIF